MEASTINQFISTGSALAGLIIGGAINYFVVNRSEKARILRETKSVEAGLVAEVSALLQISYKRDYLGEFYEILGELQHSAGLSYSIKIKFPGNIAPFYHANIDKISLLSNDKVSDIIFYHQLLTSFTQDFHPESAINEIGFTIESIKATIEILEEIHALSERIIAWNQ